MTYTHTCAPLPLSHRAYVRTGPVCVCAAVAIMSKFSTYFSCSFNLRWIEYWMCVVVVSPPSAFILAQVLLETDCVRSRHTKVAKKEKNEIKIKQKKRRKRFSRKKETNLIKTTARLLNENKSESNRNCPSDKWNGKKVTEPPNKQRRGQEHTENSSSA